MRREDYLSESELQDITGARSARKQMTWLAASSVPFRFNKHLFAEA